MKTRLFQSIVLFFIAFCSFSTAGTVRGDTGTLRMTWNEFRTTTRDCGGISIKQGFYELDRNEEWTKVKIKFDIVNKAADDKKVRYLICIFDKSQNLIYSANEDKELGDFKTEDASSQAKISSKVLFDPETVYIRLWWE